MNKENAVTIVAERPLPAPDAATEPYWVAARERKLVMPHCRNCGHFHFYPRTLCPKCNSAQLEWTACSGDGVVYSFAVIHRAPSPAFAGLVPYVVATVKLAEGPHLMTNIDNCAPDAVRIGMPVRVVFRKMSDEITLPMFEPKTTA
jgi:uncharacterized OB-fold protein